MYGDWGLGIGDWGLGIGITNNKKVYGNEHLRLSDFYSQPSSCWPVVVVMMKSWTRLQI